MDGFTLLFEDFTKTGHDQIEVTMVNREPLERYGASLEIHAQ